MNKFTPRIDPRSNQCTPRQILNRALSEVDEFTRCIVIMGRVDDDGAAWTRAFVAGTENRYEMMGMFQEAIALKPDCECE